MGGDETSVRVEEKIVRGERIVVSKVIGPLDFPAVGESRQVSFEYCVPDVTSSMVLIVKMVLMNRPIPILLEEEEIDVFG